MILIGQYDSPFVRRVAIAMRLYGLAYEHRPWSTFGDADKLAAFNPLRRVPTLVLAPARSPLTPLTEQVLIRDSIPGARIAVIEGRGHEIYVDDPEGCITALLKFLRSLDR